MVDTANDLRPKKCLFSMCNYLKLAEPFKNFPPEHAVVEGDKTLCNCTFC